MPWHLKGDEELVTDMEHENAIPPRVITVAADAHSHVKDIRRAAESVARECRRQSAFGYDLRHIEIRAILMRSDDFSENERGRR